jgi:hypothetical protein
MKRVEVAPTTGASRGNRKRAEKLSRVANSGWNAVEIHFCGPMIRDSRSSTCTMSPRDLLCMESTPVVGLRTLYSCDRVESIEPRGTLVTLILTGTFPLVRVSPMSLAIPFRQIYFLSTQLSSTIGNLDLGSFSVFEIGDFNPSVQRKLIGRSRMISRMKCCAARSFVTVQNVWGRP